MFSFSCQLILVLLSFAKGYRLAICAVQRNEGYYLPDWMTYHHHLGVSHFQIFDDGSTDDSLERIQSWVNQTQDAWVAVDSIQTSGGVFQSDLYQRCIERWRHQKYWIAFIDLDELLVPMKRNNLLRALNPFVNQSAVFVSSKVMCDYTGQSENQGSLNFIERFRNYAWPNRTEYIQGKVIVNANHPALDYCRFGTYDTKKRDRWRFFHNCFWSENPFQERKKQIVDGRKLPEEYLARNEKDQIIYHPYLDLNPETNGIRASYQNLQLNHYKFRSYQECLKKIKRGYSWYQNRYGEYQSWPQFAKEKTNPKYCRILQSKGHCLSKETNRALNLWIKIKNHNPKI